MDNIATIIGRPEFLAGGNAFLTVSNGKGEHFTYKIRLHEKSGRHYANVLKGPDNYSNYKDLALYKPALGDLMPNVYARYGVNSKEYRVLHWAVAIIHGRRECPEGWQIQHAGKCCVCARKLTTPESIAAGIGPTCAARMGGE